LRDLRQLIRLSSDRRSSATVEFSSRLRGDVSREPVDARDRITARCLAGRKFLC